LTSGAIGWGCYAGLLLMLTILACTLVIARSEVPGRGRTS